MASLSEKLRRERELRGISLKQISDDTKIGVRFLEALEEDRLELIPGEFYRRSYLRAYARYLGLDEDRAVNAYAFANQEKDPDTENEPEEQRLKMAPWLPWVVAAWALFLVVVFLVRSSSTATDAAQDPGSSNRAAPATVSEVAGVANDDAGASAPDDATGPPASLPSSSDVPVLSPSRHQASEEGALRLVLAVAESCWLEIEADGEVVTTGLKEEGFRQEVTAESEVRLWLGNAGGVSLWVNDRPLRPLGREGQVRKDLSITPDNFMDFVRTESGPS